MPKAKKPEYLRATQAAEYIGTSVGRVYELAQDGRIGQEWLTSGSSHLTSLTDLKLAVNSDQRAVAHASTLGRSRKDEQPARAW